MIETIKSFFFFFCLFYGISNLLGHLMSNQVLKKGRERKGLEFISRETVFVKSNGHEGLS